MVTVIYDDYDEDEWVHDEDEGEDDLLVCPSCSQAVHEDTQQCPHCGDWIIPVYPKGRWKEVVWALAAVMVILAMILMVL